jgi:hypothetical protein
MELVRYRMPTSSPPGVPALKGCYSCVVATHIELGGTPT